MTNSNQGNFVVPVFDKIAHFVAMVEDEEAETEIKNKKFLSKMKKNAQRNFHYKNLIVVVVVVVFVVQIDAYLVLIYFYIFASF